MAEININITERDFILLKFLNRFHIITTENAKILYNTNRYHKKRIQYLIDKKIIYRIKRNYLTLAAEGKRILESKNIKCKKSFCKKQSYFERLKRISLIATLAYKYNYSFLPSWEIKNPDNFTNQSRRYLGLLKKNKKEYLIYYIPNKSDKNYQKNVYYDMKKEFNYKRVIIFHENNLKNINNLNYKFKEILTIPVSNTDLVDIFFNEDKIDMYEIMKKTYQKDIYLSTWKLADYVLDNLIYIVILINLDLKKIDYLKYFLRENAIARKIEIITHEYYYNFLVNTFPSLKIRKVEVEEQLKGEIEFVL